MNKQQYLNQIEAETSIHQIDLLGLSACQNSKITIEDFEEINEVILQRKKVLNQLVKSN